MAERGRDLRHVAASRGKLLAFGMRRNGGWLLLVGALATAASCSDAAAPQEEDPPAQYVSARRAWRAGERESTIARITRESGFGQFSSLASYIYGDPESVVTVERNPAYAPTVAAVAASPQFSSGWMITGIDWRIVDNSQSPPDTTDWLGVFWANPAEFTWTGLIVGASSDTIIEPTIVNTTAFDAAGGKAGAGGGEARGSTGEYWQADPPYVLPSPPNGRFQITEEIYAAPVTVTSGPFTGGTLREARMRGRIRKVLMRRLIPAPPPADSITVDFSFLSVPIAAVQIECIFPSPCTGQAARVLLAARREGRLSAALMAPEDSADTLGRRRLP